MTEVRFYHLVRTDLARALPQMLQRTLERGQRALVVLGSNERVEALNAALWTYDPKSFLPHGSAAEGHAEDQPVWLTDSDENPNGAQVLFLTEGAHSNRLGDFALVAELFDGRDEEAVAAARERWKEYKAAGHELTYWRQDERGRWEQQ